MKKYFTRNRTIALFLGIITVFIGWYSLILLSNPIDDLTIDKEQYIGLFLGIFIGVLWWLQKVLIIRPYK
jgi:hypothetical protein